MKKFLLMLILVSIALPLQAYNNPKPASGIVSFYAGLGWDSYKPYDFSSMNMEVKATLSLSRWLGDLPIAVMAEWNQFGSPFRWMQKPDVDEITLNGAYELLPNSPFALTPYGGFSLLFNHISDHNGFAFNAGILSGYDPASFVRLYVPVGFQFHRDGFLLKSRFGTRWKFPRFPLGLDLGVNVMFISDYRFSKYHGDYGFSIMLGGEWL